MNCMRCGRETTSGEAFCPACLEKKQTSAPVESLDRRSVLWVEQKLHASRTAETPKEKKPISAKTFRSLWLITLALLFAAIGVTAMEYYRHRDYEALKRDLTVREADITLRENEVAAQDQKIADLERQLAETKAELASQSAATRKLETAQLEISALEKDNIALTEETDFWRKNVVFYSVGNDWYYHYYGCKNLNLALPFQVYTQKTAANSVGLLPCPVCAK